MSQLCANCVRNGAHETLTSSQIFPASSHPPPLWTNPEQSWEDVERWSPSLSLTPPHLAVVTYSNNHSIHECHNALTNSTYKESVNIWGRRLPQPSHVTLVQWPAHSLIDCKNTSTKTLPLMSSISTRATISEWHGSITWQSHDFSMTVTWCKHESHTTSTWQSHDGNMFIS